MSTVKIHKLGIQHGRYWLKKNPTIEELSHILFYSADVLIINETGRILANNLGIINIIYEETLIKKVAVRILSELKNLEIDFYNCGTSHCLAS